MTEQTYRDHLNSLQVEIEALRAKLKASQTGDTISRQAAIDTLYGITSYKDTIPLFSAVFNIEKLPSAQPEQRWIPCGEKLPEANGRYLVTRGLNACGSLWNRVYIANYSDLMGLKKEKIWWNGNVGKSDFVKLDDVIAWMPLPEPYAERRTDEN